MNCATIRERLSAWIDGELPPRDSELLEAHLTGCAECQSQALAERVQREELHAAFAPHRAAAERVAERVVAEWQTASSSEAMAESVVSPSSGQPSGSPWLSLLLAAALGFLLAVVIFRPWESQTPIAKRPVDPPLAAPSTAPPVARVVAATGNVEIHEPGALPLQCSPAGNLGIFTCPSNSTISTGPNIRCEVETANGSVIRLNQETQIKFTAADTVEIQRGQIWCKSPDKIALRVVTAPLGPPATKQPVSPWSAACPSNACMTAAYDDGRMRVTSSSGEVEVRTARGSERLQSGETCAIAEGQIVKSSAPDPLLAASWMQPLLVLKGDSAGELDQRAEQLLARLDSTPQDLTYEHELRILGEFAVPALVRSVQDTAQPAARRLQTMRLVADLATGPAAGELIELLAADDAETRVLAALTLKRLTGLDQDCPESQWREKSETADVALAAWRAWWQMHRGQFPAAPRDALPMRKLML